jgi:hypothetical protein
MVIGFSRARAVALALAIACVTPLFAAAVHAEQIFTYDNEGEVAGAAMSKPRFNQAVVGKTMRYCANLSPELSVTAQDALQNWTVRNEWSVGAADRLAADARSRFSASAPSLREEWEQVEKMMEAQVEVTSDLFVKQLEAITLEKYRLKMCSQYVAVVNAGKFDVSAEADDPRIFELLSKHRR